MAATAGAGRSPCPQVGYITDGPGGPLASLLRLALSWHFHPLLDAHRT
jgi:hypothetical protein